ncbi:hypothetical protein T492DRAFT_903547, partial [Pavlovales sp. CCMP2436]
MSREMPGPGGRATREPHLISPTIFVADLPPDFSESQLSEIFRRVPGYATSRLRTDKTMKVVGFVDFETADFASLAMQQLDGQRVPGLGNPLRIQFAKASRGIPVPAQKRMRGDDEMGVGRSTPPNLRGDSRGMADHGAPPQRSGQPRSSQAPMLPPPPHMGPMGYPPHNGRQAPMPAMMPAPMPFTAYYAPTPPEPAIPQDASNTLYVENVPPDATQRELSHIFRQGYRMDATDTRGLGCDFAKINQSRTPGPRTDGGRQGGQAGEGRQGGQAGRMAEGEGGYNESAPGGYVERAPRTEQRDNNDGGRDNNDGGRAHPGNNDGGRVRGDGGDSGMRAARDNGGGGGDSGGGGGGGRSSGGGGGV